MKTKALTLMIAAFAIVIAGSANAIGQKADDASGKQTQVQSQTEIQTSNQGEASQVQTQNSQQTQSEEGMGVSGEGVKTQDREQKQLKNGSGDGAQVENQNKAQGQGESGQNGTMQKGSADSGQIGQQHRSRVANAVQEMLQVADRSGGVGQQIRVIAQTQTQNREKLDASIEKVNKRSKLAKFFFGANYKEIANAENIVEANRLQIQELNQVMSQLENEGDRQKLMEQIQVLEQVNNETQDSIKASQGGFSLLGWMFKMFSK